jgi:DNA-directed RNA polymerase specialized sigma24 family protein
MPRQKNRGNSKRVHQDFHLSTGDAFSLAHDSSEAEDFLQDACLSLLGSGASWERSYLFATIRNRFIDRYRLIGFWRMLECTSLCT